MVSRQRSRLAGDKLSQPAQIRRCVHSHSTHPWGHEIFLLGISVQSHLSLLPWLSHSTALEDASWRSGELVCEAHAKSYPPHSVWVGAADRQTGSTLGEALPVGASRSVRLPTGSCVPEAAHHERHLCAVSTSHVTRAAPSGEAAAARRMAWAAPGRASLHLSGLISPFAMGQGWTGYAQISLYL